MVSFDKNDKIEIGIFLAVCFSLFVMINFVGDCEVGIEDRKCDTYLHQIETHCDYRSDENIAWYLERLCRLQNAEHGSGLDCNNLEVLCK